MRVRFCQILLSSFGGPGDSGSAIFSVACATVRGNFLTGQISYLSEADLIRIQTCSTTRLAFIRQSLQKKRVSDRVLLSPPNSTRTGNDALWKLFSGQCI
ncbi:hypothetical protein DPMN_144775 [Dreissena polymorpha]|uniref:Uncharacterized protein n=1 Tax=Dreissena polymorpha TaxID=45954 RepID=A0A9D4F3U6_DREPO|nr:hypothetical protein DPMN_144775 [Dreissena polymorpha]